MASRKKQDVITHPDFVRVAERRAFVLRMRKTGATYEDIAMQAERHFGKDQLPASWNASFAYKDVRTVLEQHREEIRETVQEVVEIELERLDRMMLGLWNGAMNGDTTSVNAVLKIMDRRSKLLGLDKPQKMQIDVTQLTDAELEELINGG